MATSSISSPGISSGLDVNGIISKLMELERIPLTKLNMRETDYQAKVSAYGTIKSTLSSLRTAANALQNTATFTSNTASVSDSTVLSASASTTAAAGTYNISVTQLAKFHTVRSNTAYAATSDTFNSGTLAIKIHGGAAVNVTIDNTNNTLAGIRQAINNANAGVTATIVNDGSTNRLVLRSNTSGSVGDINVTVTEDGLTAGTHALTGIDSASLVQTQAADDAMLNINGIDITRTSNTISDAVDGVTLNLTKGTLASPGTTVLTVASDKSATTTAINSFVKAYNDVVNLLKTDTTYNSTTKTAAVLSGDGAIRSLQSQLSSLEHTSVSGVAGGISTLSDIGVSVQKDGTLAVDSTKLSAALADSNKDVTSLFTQMTSGNEGIGVKFSTALQSILGFDGLIASRTSGLQTSIKDIGTTRDALNLRLTQIEARYRAQFTALDQLTASMNKTSQYLTQQLANLPSSK